MVRNFCELAKITQINVMRHICLKAKKFMNNVNNELESTFQRSYTQINFNRAAKL